MVAIAEERLDRIKHSDARYRNGRLYAGLPMRSITYCLGALGIGVDQLTAVVFTNTAVRGHDGVEREMRLTDCVPQFPWHPNTKFTLLPHHLAHAFSAYYPSDFEEAAVLVIDGSGSVVRREQSACGYISYVERATVGVGTRAGLRTTRVITDRTPEGVGRWVDDASRAALSDDMLAALGQNSIGDLYRRATMHIGYGVYDAGKTMGLAPYGDRRHTSTMQRMVQLSDETFDISPFLQEAGDIAFPGSFAKLFGPPGCSPENPSPNDSAIARAAQEILERCVLHMASVALRQSPSKSLCYAGGVALNTVANRRILLETNVKHLFVQPASTDDGTAVGAAIFGWTEVLRQDPRAVRWGACLGHPYSSSVIESAIREGLAGTDKITIRRIDGPEAIVDQLVEGKIVGCFVGGSEFGPRALGHRSILADPRRPDMKAVLNARVKHREGFRPFAASVLREEQGVYFDSCTDSPYMLLVADVRPERRDQIPAVTHVDGTCRVQSVDALAQPHLHSLLREFARRTGVPLVLNTSLNVAGEPIVETPLDAVECFLGTDIDALYLDGFWLEKKSSQ